MDRWNAFWKMIALRRQAGSPAIGWHVLLPIVVVWAGLTALAGVVTFTQQRDALEKAKQDELTWVADVQVAALRRWVCDKLNDAGSHGERQHLVLEAERWQQRGSPSEAEAAPWRTKLERIRITYGLRGVTIFDLTGRRMVGAGQTPATDAPLVARTLAAGVPVMSDLRWVEEGETRYLEIGFAAPMRAYDGSEPRNVGVIYMSADPETELYPLLGWLPRKSASTEVVLARGEGDGVLFLSPLRKRPGPPLTLWLPLSAQSMAGRAVAGFEGVAEGTDYAGTPVLAATRAVPQTPWVLVVRTSRAELRAPAVRTAAVSATLFGAFLFGLGAAVWLWHRGNATAALAREMARSSAYTRSLIEASLDPLVTISPEGRITDVNETTTKVTGLSREKLVGTDFADYFTEPQKARQGYQRVFAEGCVADYPLTIRGQDGRLIDVLYNASVYRDGQGQVLGVFAAARDITERKCAEESLRRSNRELGIRSRINDVLLRIPDERMYEEVLGILLEELQSEFGVFGYIDEGGALV